MSSYTPPIFTAILFIFWQRSRSISLLCIPLGGPGWTWTNNHIKHLIYSQGWYQLHCTDPNKKYLFILIYLILYCLNQFGGPPWTQTRTSTRRRIYRNLFKNSAVKVFIKSRKEIGLPRPLCLSIPPMTHIYISITRGPSPYVHNLRVYSISEETQSELRGATPNFWSQSFDRLRLWVFS